MQIKELDEQTNADGFWDDPKNGKIIMRKMRDVKSWVTAYDDIVKANEDLGVLFDFAKEGEAEEEEVDKQYEETHNAYFDALDELKIVQLLGYNMEVYDNAIIGSGVK